MVWNYKYADVEFGRLQARDLLQHLWTGPISNAPVDIVQVTAFHWKKSCMSLFWLLGRQFEHYRLLPQQAMSSMSIIRLLVHAGQPCESDFGKENRVET